MSGERLRRAIAAIDAVNAQDPGRIVTAAGGPPRPKELVHAELVTRWIEALVSAPGEALLLAARAHHLRRWAVPRSDYPPGLAGYHRWRKELHRRHADETALILRQAGYEPALIERVSAIIQKRGLGRDAEVQALEDALCLVFVETQLEEFAGRHPPEKVRHIVASTLRKMSAAGRAAALGLDLPEATRRIVEEALESGGTEGLRD